MSYIKEQTLHTRKFKDRQFVIKSDGSIEFTPINGAVTINGDLRVTGSSSGPINSLTYYVSLEGNDLNDGLSAGPDRAKRSITSAVVAAPAVVFHEPTDRPLMVSKGCVGASPSSKRNQASAPNFVPRSFWI